MNKNVKFVRHKLKSSHLAIFVNANFQSRKCIFVSSIAYLSPTTDLLKIAHWKQNNKFQPLLLWFFYMQWTISMAIRLGNFFRLFTKQESLHTFYRRCNVRVLKSLYFNRNLGTCRTCRLSSFPEESRMGKNIQAWSRSTGLQFWCYVYRQQGRRRISSSFIKMRLLEI